MGGHGQVHLSSAEVSGRRSKVLGDEVDFLEEKSANDSPDDPEKEHRHFLCSGIGTAAGAYTDWLKCKNLKVGRCYWRDSPQPR